MLVRASPWPPAEACEALSVSTDIRGRVWGVGFQRSKLQHTADTLKDGPCTRTRPLTRLIPVVPLVKICRGAGFLAGVLRARPAKSSRAKVTL